MGWPGIWVLGSWGRGEASGLGLGIDAGNTLVSQKINRPGKWEWARNLKPGCMPLRMFGVLKGWMGPQRSAPNARALFIPPHPKSLLQISVSRALFQAPGALICSCPFPHLLPQPPPLGLALPVPESPALSIWLDRDFKSWSFLLLPVPQSLLPSCAPPPPLLAGWLVLDAVSLFLPRMHLLPPLADPQLRPLWPDQSSPGLSSRSSLSSSSLFLSQFPLIASVSLLPPGLTSIHTSHLPIIIIIYAHLFVPLPLLCAYSMRFSPSSLERTFISQPTLSQSLLSGTQAVRLRKILGGQKHGML